MTTETQECQICRRLLPMGDFHIARENRTGRTKQCGRCLAVLRSERRQQYNLKHFYKMSVEDYNHMHASQGGVCALCRRPETGAKVTGKFLKGGTRRLAVDHDHSCCPGSRSCGRCVRGLLCSRCNAGLGYLEDNIEVLERALDYIESFRSTL